MLVLADFSGRLLYIIYITMLHCHLVSHLKTLYRILSTVLIYMNQTWFLHGLTISTKETRNDTCKSMPEASIDFQNVKQWLTAFIITSCTKCQTMFSSIHYYKLHILNLNVISFLLFCRYLFQPEVKSWYWQSYGQCYHGLWKFQQGEVSLSGRMQTTGQYGGPPTSHSQIQDKTRGQRRGTQSNAPTSKMCWWPATHTTGRLPNFQVSTLK